MKPGLLLHPRNLVVYALVAGAVLASTRLGLNTWAVGSALMVLLVVHYFVMPAIALRRLPGFDAALRRMIVAGKQDDLLRFYRSHLLLRVFCPPGVMAHRRGQIHLARRAWTPALQAYHEARRASLPREQYAISLGYAEAGFHVGEDTQIIPVLAGLVADVRTQSATRFLLVHALVANPERRAHAASELERMERMAGPDDGPLVDLARAEVLAAEGKRSRAEKVLSGLDESGLPATLAPLAVLLRAKLMFVRGRKADAKKLFARVRSDGCSGRALVELEEFLAG